MTSHKQARPVDEAEIELGLYFTDGPRTRLIQTHFIHPKLEKPITLTVKKGAFLWTVGVKAICIFFIRWAAWARRLQAGRLEREPVFQGVRPSPAATLNDVLTKRPAWTTKMFGRMKGVGPLLPSIIDRWNSDFKTAPQEAVRLALNQEYLPASSIGIFLGEHDQGEELLADPERLLDLASDIEQQLANKPSLPGRDLNGHKPELPFGNLVELPDAFVGRQQEIEGLCELVADKSAQLLTISGSPGVGKTRLALRLGSVIQNRYAGGCWFADVSEATSPEEITQAVARAFEVPLSGKEASGLVIANVLQYRKPLLLILDNFEQVVEHATATVGMWRQRARHVHFLITSRCPLGIAGEHLFELEPLPSPPTARVASSTTGELAVYDSVKLFVERATQVKPSFVFDQGNAKTIGKICAALEGIPLAVELAAGRTKILHPTEIVQKLSEKFRLLKSTRRDIPARQRTMVAAIDWSCDLLSPCDRQAFLQASVFRGGFFLEAAQAVIDLSDFEGAPPMLDVLQALREQNLLKTYDTKYGTRFAMFVVLREYAQERWEQESLLTQQNALLSRHANHFITYASTWAERIHTANAVESLDRLQLETDNIFSVHEWALAVGDRKKAAEMILAFAQTLAIRGPVEQRTSRMELSLTAPGSLKRDLRVKLLTNLSEAYQHIGVWERALMLADEAVKLAEPSNLLSCDAAALVQRASILELRGKHNAVLKDLATSQGIYRRLKYQRGITICNERRGRLFRERGDFKNANKFYAQAELAAKKLGDKLLTSRIADERGKALCWLGDCHGAIKCFSDAEAINRQLGDEYHLAGNLSNRGLALHELGDNYHALQDNAEAERINRKIGNKAWLAANIHNRGGVLFETGSVDDAFKCYQAAEHINRELGNKQYLANNMAAQGSVFREKSDYEKALACYSEAENLNRELHNFDELADCIAKKGRILLSLGRKGEARVCLRAALALQEKIGVNRTLRHFEYCVTLGQVEKELANPRGVERIVLKAQNVAKQLKLTEGHPKPVVRMAIKSLRTLQDYLGQLGESTSSTS